MINDKREIQRKLRILRYAEEIDHVAKTCRYFGIGRASFYRWRKAYAERGEAGLINAPPIPKWHANRTSSPRPALRTDQSRRPDKTNLRAF
jgi:transposase-like protein